MKAIVVQAFGGPEQLALQDVPDPTDDVVVAAAWAGVNFVDTYQREGRYPGVTLPLMPGLEGSGIVLRAPVNSEWQTGDRVAYTTGVQGSYAEQVSVQAEHLLRVPADVSLRAAAAALEQGLTASMLIDDVARLKVGDTVLVHAAAGGVGGWLVQWLRARGHRVIGTASSDAKLAWLAGVGVEPVRYAGDTDWAADVLRLTSGRGVHVVFDSVGRSTFAGSLAVLARRGHLVLFGLASGQPEPVDVLQLMLKSLTLSRPRLPDYLADPATLQRRAARVFAALSDGTVHLRIDREVALADAAQAHRALAGRGTQGKLLLSIAPALV
jgi:NADPH:quinone reductase